MSQRVRSIAVAGDVSVDWLGVMVPPREPAPGEAKQVLNWKLYTGLHMVARRGAALLLAEMAGQASGLPVRTHELGSLETLGPDEVVHSIVELAAFPATLDKKDSKNLVYRVERFCGFAGPATGMPRLAPVADDDPQADLVLLDDVGNGFRDAPAAWPAALRTPQHQPIVVLKMSRPLARGQLWEALRRAHTDRLVVVINADDLRADGVQISRRLSWERTAKDFVWQLASNPSLVPLANCGHLIVRFGIDGAIHYCKCEGEVESRLYYDPAVAEDGFRDGMSGDMMGFACAFVAAVAAHVASAGLPGIGEGVRAGIRSSRRLLAAGFGKNIDDLQYPGALLFRPADASEPPIADVSVPNPTVAEPADPAFWCILQDVSGVRLEDMAYDMIVRGDGASLQGVPIGRFRALRTVDRAEIESYRSIRNLIVEYLHTSNPKRPLSLAVFGPPGSGKSFGVTEVAESAAPGRIERIEFNVSQFGSREDLISAFHRVRDCVLGGKVPLVFFDEFDTSFDGKLGWLKHFLAPMQDGTFKEGDTLHPVGKAIFAFAGGTSETYEQFAREAGDSADGATARLEFRDAKGPDFVSRLRGYVNVLGPNPLSPADHFFMIRRAMLLRSLVERKARQLLDRRGHARLDPGVLRALIKVPRYKHGVRSMEAVLDMSMLADRESFEQAALPSVEQLKLHVDAEIFCRLVIRDVLFGGARELLAQAIHDKYREDQKDNKKPEDPSVQPWERLRDDLRESNRQQADQIPDKLRRIGCGFTPVTGRKPEPFQLTPQEVELLAEMEHDRWNAEKLLDGWTYGKIKDAAKKNHPCLLPWGELTEEVKQYDRDAVVGIPPLLARAGFEIYRLDGAARRS